MEARKGNKVYSIDKREADAFAANGYDIYEGGKLVKHAVGKTVPIEEHERVVAELEALKKPKARTAKKAEAEDE